MAKGPAGGCSVSVRRKLPLTHRGAKSLSNHTCWTRTQEGDSVASLRWQMRYRQWRLEHAILKCVADRPSLTFGICFGLGWLSSSEVGPFLLSTKLECEQFLESDLNDLVLRVPDFRLSDSPFNPDFLKLLIPLQKASIQEPRGPITEVYLVVDGQVCTVRYAWMQDEIDRFHETERQDGSIPFSVVVNDFSDRVVTRMRADEVYSTMLGIERLVYRDAEHYPKPLVEAVAVVEWLADTRNGTLEQYFARQKTRPTRTEVYSFVLSGLERIGHDAGADLLREAIAIYSHFEDDIEKARSSMGIAPVPRVEESDIMFRFYQMEMEIQSRLGDYFVAHPLEFAVPEWRRRWYKL